MNIRKVCPPAVAIAALFGGSALAADMDAKLPKPSDIKHASSDSAVNQDLANAVAVKISKSGVGEGADLTITTDNGAVTLTGVVGDASQKKAILQEARTVKGVKVVKDGLKVDSGLIQAQGSDAPATLPPVGPVAGMPSGPVAGMPPVGIPPTGGPAVEPAPLGGMPGGAPADGFAPPLPPNAWPTYAPYNNVSRVAYPSAYPYNAFPFIGPYYPFPKVPIGWRSVTLSWEDGHWWYNRSAVPHDYWRVRFW